ncbi:MAG: putative ABC transporter ATP-binding protein [Methanomassiliicoccales archaeon PtaU1.Bin124]|nr:MAG: putative ABC transporter ATP-binding protein [Methanomassiliicoccales archaeon PtaU1.Bin124]
MIETNEVMKTYETLSGRITALDQANISIKDGEFVLIVGRSGSGKSTLLSILGGLTRPSSGKVMLNGKDLWAMNDEDLSEVRGSELGFVFQFPGLLPTLNTLENVMLPTMFCSKVEEDPSERATILLQTVGLGDKLDSFPNQLSGGELKRAAIARSLMNNPSIILADEPTGDLDVNTEKEIMDMFCRINKLGKTVVMVTHNQDLACFASRVLSMERGIVSEEEGQKCERI